MTDWDVAKAYGGPMEFDRQENTIYLVDRETGEWVKAVEIFDKYFEEVKE